MRTLGVIAESLYRALRVMPCRCHYGWRDKAPDMVLIKLCGRCAAIADYEEFLRAAPTTGFEVSSAKHEETT